MKNLSSNILSTIKSKIQILNLDHLSNEQTIGIGFLGGDFGCICDMYLNDLHYNNDSIPDLHLGKILENLGSHINVCSYCNGLAGVGVGLTLLENKGYLSGAIDNLSDFDRIIYQWYQSCLRKENIDPLHGALGALLYFTYRGGYTNLAHQALLDWAVYLSNHLENTNIGTTVGFRTFDDTPPHNLSLSHGVSGLVMITIRAIENICVPKEQIYLFDDILNKLGKYLCNNIIINDSQLSCTSSFGLDENQPSPSRLAWCYGDLGVGLALNRIADRFNNEDYKQMAKSLFIHNSKRRSERQTLMWDKCICHGSAGVYRIFRHLNDNVWNGEFSDTVDYWYDYTFGEVFKNPESLVKEFSYYDNTKKQFELRYNILDGISGIGLALSDDDFIDNALYIK